MEAAAASAVAVEVYNDGKRAVCHYCSKVDFSKGLNDNYERLEEEAGKLSARRNDIENEANRDNTKDLSTECKNWISSVKKHEKEVQELATKYKSKYSRRKGRVWDPIFAPSRVKFSKCLTKKCEELRRLWSEGMFERGTLVEKPPECVITRHGPKTEDKPSLHQAVKEILGHLRDRNVRRVGLWGMMGVGKTTIMQNVNNNEDIPNMFDIVIWLTVKDWSITELQRAITLRLKLDVENITNLDEIALRISRALECKRYLLLLDEVYNSFDLGKIGIYDNQNDSKVVLATRDHRICSQMHTNDEVHAQQLSKNDACKMFLEQVNRNVNLSDIEPIARLVARECLCLPLVIEKVARAFRMKMDNCRSWSEGLERLRRSTNTIDEDMAELIGFLKFCYDELGAEKKKFCFLYGALYPEDCEIYIDHLLECWKSEGFIHDANKFKVAREKGQDILDELILRSLLERSERMNYVRMNKVLRNMALQISSESDNFKVLVRIPQEQQQPHNEVEWQHVNRISLMDNELCLLPEMRNCKNLLTLFLWRNCSLEVIPDSFFVLKENLRVLDLHDTRIKSLPSSISCLKHLRALYLNSCVHLTELPFDIEKLICLEILDIQGTGINLSIQIGRLIGLKCLRLSLSNVGMGQSRDVEFGKDVLSSLCSLEELGINVNQDIQELDTVVNAIAQVVASLKHFTSLSLCFPGVDCLEKFISIFSPWKNYDHFTFQFSVVHSDSTTYQILGYLDYQKRRCLKFVNAEVIHPAIFEVLAKADVFELIDLKRPSKLSDAGADNINRIRDCLIEGCNEIETLVDGNSITKSALICLEEMHINDAANLTSIWEGVVHVGSLARLKSLTLFKCLSLKKIFSNGMIAQLAELQILKVEHCSEIEEIIMESENGGLEPDVLPSLKTLVLLDLPKVRSICISDSITWSSLQKIKISMCQLLTKLPFNNENAINLRCIEVQQSWWNALEWQEEAIEERLRTLCHFN